MDKTQKYFIWGLVVIVLLIFAIPWLKRLFSKQDEQPQPTGGKKPPVSDGKKQEAKELNLNLILKKGSKGIEVKELQKLLLSSSKLPVIVDKEKGTVTAQISIDGDFGQQTENALFKVKGVKSITLNQYKSL